MRQSTEEKLYHDLRQDGFYHDGRTFPNEKFQRKTILNMGGAVVEEYDVTITDGNVKSCKFSITFHLPEGLEKKFIRYEPFESIRTSYMKFPLLVCPYSGELTFIHKSNTYVKFLEHYTGEFCKSVLKVLIDILPEANYLINSAARTHDSMMHHYIKHAGLMQAAGIGYYNDEHQHNPELRSYKRRIDT